MITNFFFGFLIIVPSVTIALTISDIQVIMKYFSSIFGFFLLVVIPCLIVYKYREKLENSNISKGQLNTSYLNRNFYLYILGFIGLGILSVIIINLINSNSKTCVAEQAFL